jgi:hypothetical protein
MAQPARFSDIPVEPDTQITCETTVNLGGIEACHQEWIWERVRAESLVFVVDEVDTLDDDELEGLV